MKRRLFPTAAALFTTIAFSLAGLARGAVVPPALPGGTSSSGASTSSSNATSSSSSAGNVSSGTATNNTSSATNSSTLPALPSASTSTNAGSQSGSTGSSASGSITARGRVVNITLPSAASSNAFVRFTNRVDLRALPAQLRTRLGELVQRSHTYAPQRTFPGGSGISELTGYALLDQSGLVATNLFATGLNPAVASTNGNASARTNLSPIGAVRILQILPTNGSTTVSSNLTDPGCFDFFTDIAGLGPIQNESGWYEGWLIHDLIVPAVAAAGTNSLAAAGSITTEDATALAGLGTGNNVPGTVFTIDGNAPTSGITGTNASSTTGTTNSAGTSTNGTTSATNGIQTLNTVAVYVSAGTFNALQRNDAHAYKQINRYTDWSFPLYEYPFTGGLEGTFAAGLIGARSSIVPGSGPSGITNSPVLYGDNPDNPRDPDRTPFTILTNNPNALINTNLANPEFRLRAIPSGVAREILLDVLMRRASFEPTITDFNQRLFDAYAFEVAKVDTNRDGVISFEEADAAANAGLPMFLPVSDFNRFAVTREINDGLLAPRFAPSQRAWVLQGTLQPVATPVTSSTTLIEEVE